MGHSQRRNPGSDRLLLDVLGEGGTVLGELGVEGSRKIAGWVEGMLVSFEEHLLGVFTAALWLGASPITYS
jgi:hypothetical protein